MSEETIEKLARAGYHAYGGVTDWKNYQGLPMPAWEALPEKIHLAWYAAVRAVAEGVTEQLSTNP